MKVELDFKCEVGDLIMCRAICMVLPHKVVVHEPEISHWWSLGDFNNCLVTGYINSLNDDMRCCLLLKKIRFEEFANIDYLVVLYEGTIYHIYDDIEIGNWCPFNSTKKIRNTSFSRYRKRDQNKQRLILRMVERRTEKL